MKVLFYLTTMLCALLTSAAAGASDFRGGLNWGNGWYDLSLAPINTGAGIFGGIACGAMDASINSPDAPLNPPNGSAGVSQYGANYLACLCQNRSGPVPLDSCPGECTHSPGAPIPSGVIQHSTLASLYGPGTFTPELQLGVAGAFAASSDGNIYYINMAGSNPCFLPSYLGDPSGGTGDPSMAALGGWGWFDSLPTTSVLGLAFQPGTETTAGLYALGNDNNVYYHDFFAGDGWWPAGLQNVASISYSPYLAEVVAMLTDGSVYFLFNGQFWQAPSVEPPCTLNWDSSQNCMIAVGGALGAWSDPLWGLLLGYYMDSTTGWFADTEMSATFQEYAFPVGAYSTSAPALLVLGQDTALNPPRTESWQTLFEGASWAPFGDTYWVITNKYRLYAFSP